MPKQKTRKSVIKRFKLTKTGKLVHRAQMTRHLKKNKSKSQKRRGKIMREVTGRIKRRIKKMM